ncbi:MAG: hypothetical protein PUG48_01305 [Clostridia bacterium]|nr:hypothetical protein [Clostridia bacterium]
MPLPLIIGIAAAVAGIAGIGSGIHGGVKMKEANDKMKSAEEKQKRNTEKFEKQQEITYKSMDLLGKLELKILKSFSEFSNTIEKIQNRPQFKNFSKEGEELPTYDKTELEDVSIGAGILLGGLSGAALGVAGGFAAAGATTAAVAALGTASTGTAIASLSGAAATNATLAALGGGAIAAGGGGIALGTTVLGAATLGVGVLIGGVIFGITGNILSGKADEAYSQMEENEKQINKICNYLADLDLVAKKYYDTLKTVNSKYEETFGYIWYIVNKLNKTDWNDFSEVEKTATQNTVLLVGLLYKMCKVKLVNKSENDNEINTINQTEIDDTIEKANTIIKNLQWIDK